MPPLLSYWKCCAVAANDDLGNLGREMPINRRDEKAALVRELIEALTALGNYLTAAHHEFDKQPGPVGEMLGEAIEKSLGQYERASNCVRRLRQFVLRGGAGDNNRQGSD
jgi:hypothetical protein